MILSYASEVGAREAAYLALLQSSRQECFIDESLELWNQRYSPSQKDYNLAKEIACGACRRALTLDYYADALAGHSLSIKRKERLFLHTALYQYFLMDRIPLYALTHETIQIAKKYCHSTFVKFLNVLLRKLENCAIPLPEDDSPASLSVRYSYPIFFIEELIHDYGIVKAIEILQVGNHANPPMARVRALQEALPKGLSPLPNSDVKMVVIESTEALKALVQDSNYYIQNATPALLIHHLASALPSPKNVLDLCASPGGKLLAIHDIFPQAHLYGNDLTVEKLKRLEQNLAKYAIQATLSSGPGEHYASATQFDLVILDVPCSNTGVLNKRPEARWRLTPEAIAGLKKTQLALLTNALTLLKPQGELWYMTCSILKAENEKLIEGFAKSHHLDIKTTYNQLPTSSGHDGGFGCALVYNAKGDFKAH